MEVSHRYMYTTLMAMKDLSAFENRLTLLSDEVMDLNAVCKAAQCGVSGVVMGNDMDLSIRQV